MYRGQHVTTSAIDMNSSDFCMLPHLYGPAIFKFPDAHTYGQAQAQRECDDVIRVDFTKSMPGNGHYVQSL